MYLVLSGQSTSKLLSAWLWVQLLMLLLFISYLFGNIAFIDKMNSAYIYIYGGFTFLYVYAYTELMDGNKYAVIWEMLKSVAGIVIVFYTSDWFGAGFFLPGIKYLLVGYFVLSVIVTAWFVFTELRSRELNLSV